MLRRLAILIAVGIVAISAMASSPRPAGAQPGVDWDQEYVKTLFDGRQLAPVEGVWQFGGHGAVVAIIKSSVAGVDWEGGASSPRTSSVSSQPPGDYLIYLVDSPMLDVEPGTLIGTANNTPRNSVYDAQLQNKKLGKQSNITSQTLTLTVNPGGTLTTKPYKTGYTLSVRRWFSYLFRLTVIDNTHDRPEGLDGARRLYPTSLSDSYPISL